VAEPTQYPVKTHLLSGKGPAGRGKGRSPFGAETVPSGKHPTDKPLLSARGLVLLTGCGLIAAVAMFTNLSYGLPLWYHPDEILKVDFVEGIPQGKLPTDFLHPHFMLYFGVPFVLLGKLVGAAPHLAARAAVASLGVATVCLLFVVGNTLAGRMAGFAAALFYATAPLAVVTAHDFKEDIPLAFWLTVQILFLVRYLQGEGARPRDLYLSALALGGAMGTKYTAFAAAPLLVGAVLLGPTSGRHWKTLGFAALTAGAVFLVCTPALLLAPHSFLVDAGFEGQHAIFGHATIMGRDAEGRILGDHWLRISGLSYFWTYHLRYSLLPGISAAGLLLTLVGTAVAFARGGAGWRLVASGLVLFYFLIETLPLKPPPFAARYMVVVLPYTSLLCGRAVAFAMESPLPRRLLIGLVAAATLALNGAETLRQVRAMRPETRDEARAWIYQHIPPGSTLIQAGKIDYSPLRYLSRPPGFPYTLYVLPESTLSEILAGRQDVAAYLIVSSFTYQRFLDHPDFDPEAYRFYRMVFDRYTPLATFSPPVRPIGFHNPTIQIFRPGDASPTSAVPR